MSENKNNDFSGHVPNNKAEAEVLIAEGKRLWALGRHGEAMTAYRHALELDPDSPAALLLEHSQSVMDFFNPDLLNP